MFQIGTTLKKGLKIMAIDSEKYSNSELKPFKGAL